MPQSDLHVEPDTPKPAPIRTLTAREVATIRAALRLWIETPPELIGDLCYVEADNTVIADASEIEPLLLDLAAVDQVILRRVP